MLKLSHLEQLAGGEVADEAAVGGQEVVIWQVFEFGPADFLVDVVDDFPGELVNGEELEIDGAAMAVVVADVGDMGADNGGYAEFLVEFSGQGLLGAFAGLDFTAGKLPLRGHGLVGAALPDEDFTAAYDQGRGDEAKGRAVGPGCALGLSLRHSSSVNPSKEKQKASAVGGFGARLSRPFRKERGMDGAPSIYSPATAASMPSAAVGRK